MNYQSQLQFSEYKQMVIEKDNQTSKVFTMAIYSCFIYMLFSAFNITGKMLITQIYIYAFSPEFPEYENFTAVTFVNVQWFAFQIVGPLILPIMPRLVSQIKFRIIMVVASLGPLIFTLPALYAALCKGSDAHSCSIYAIYTTALVISMISGFLQSVLLFSMLYYLTNLADKDSIIYYGAFYFIHNFQWLLGSLLGNLFVQYFYIPSAEHQHHPYITIQQAYYIMCLCQFIISLLYLTLPEELPQCKVKNFTSRIQKLQLKNSPKTPQIDTLKQLLLQDELRLDEEDEGDPFGPAFIKKKKKSQSVMTLQCFSIKDEDLMLIATKSGSGELISLMEYQDNNYVQNLLLTLKKLYVSGNAWIVIIIYNVANIEAFLLLYLFAFVNTPTGDIDEKIYLIFTGYFYVGIGQIFGCFGMGLFGEFDDKIRSLYMQLGVMEFGIMLGWTSFFLELDLIVNVCLCCLGYCNSSLTSTLISIQMIEFSKFIYMIDLMYVLYCFSFAIASLFFIICNYVQSSVSLAIVQVVSLFTILAIYQVHKNYKLKQSKVKNKYIL